MVVNIGNGYTSGSGDPRRALWAGPAAGVSGSRRGTGGAMGEVVGYSGAP